MIATDDDDVDYDAPGPGGARRKSHQRLGCNFDTATNAICQPTLHAALCQPSTCDPLSTLHTLLNLFCRPSACDPLPLC